MKKFIKGGRKRRRYGAKTRAAMRFYLNRNYFAAALLGMRNSSHLGEGRQR